MGRSAKTFLSVLFPFIALNGAMAAVFPLLIIITLLPVIALSGLKIHIQRGNKPGRFYIAGTYIYYFLIAFQCFILIRLAFAYFPLFLLIVIAFSTVLFLKRKIGFEIASGLVLNVSVALVFSLMVSPRFSPEIFDTLSLYEPIVKPVYLFAGDPASPDPEAFNVYEGVRSISTDVSGKMFFTAKGKGDGFQSLFCVDMNSGEKLWSTGESRIWDAEVLPGGDRLLASDFYGRKLLVLDPETGAHTGDIEANPFPTMVVIDKFYDRVFALHEGQGRYIEYSLPDLKVKRRKITFSSPIAAAVDWQSGELYAANWMFPFMLSEIDLYNMSVKRVKFPLSFSGTGVALDGERHRVYIANAVAGRILAVDRDTFKTVGAIRTRPGVRPVVVDEERRLIYAGNMLSEYLYVYDFDHYLVNTVFIGRNCRALHLDETTGRLFAGTSLGVLEIDADKLYADP